MYRRDSIYTMGTQIRFNNDGERELRSAYYNMLYNTLDNIITWLGLHIYCLLYYSVPPKKN